MTELSRRSLFAGIGALIAAPAIVRAASLMHVRAIVPMRRYLTLDEVTREAINQLLIERAAASEAYLNGMEVAGNEMIYASWQHFRAQPEWVETVYPIVRAA